MKCAVVARAPTKRPHTECFSHSFRRETISRQTMPSFAFPCHSAPEVQGVTVGQSVHRTCCHAERLLGRNHLPIHLRAIVRAALRHEVTGNIGKAIWLLFAAVLGLLADCLRESRQPAIGPGHRA